jgi:LysM repeat protein
MKKKWKDFYVNLPHQKKVLWCRYQIARGETLESIASKHNVRADALKTINRLTSSRISAGHHLFIPRSDSLLDSSIAYTLPPESEIKMLDLPDYEFAGVVVRHRIRSGDNLGKIARRYHVSIAQLCRWNGVTRRTILRLGRVLVVSRPQPLPATSPAAPATVSVADAATTTHLVQIGDTPFSVSRKYNINIQDLATLNNLDISHPIIRIGQVLKLSATAAVTMEKASPDSIGPAAGSDSLVAAATNPAPAQHNPDSASKIQPTPAKTVTLAEKKSKAPEVPADTASQRAGARSSCYHVVATGENLYRISLKYAVPVVSLMKANHIADVSLVRTGDSLFIPAAFDVAKPMEGQEVPGIVYYKVKDGDTLWRIASQFGVPIDSLYKNNNLTPDTVLTPGLVIKVVTSGDM